MIRVAEDELICDLAEYYGLYDYRILPPKTVAVLVCGLREEARIKRKMNELAGKSRFTYDELLKAVIVDRLNWLCWTKTKDARHGRKRPESIANRMLRPAKVHGAKGFRTVEDFTKWHDKFIEG